MPPAEVGVVGAIESIQAGLDVVLVVGAEVQTTVRPREGADYLARASHYATSGPSTILPSQPCSPAVPKPIKKPMG